MRKNAFIAKFVDKCPQKKIPNKIFTKQTELEKKNPNDSNLVQLKLVCS